jgi:hypothetical protein
MNRIAATAVARLAAFARLARFAGPAASLVLAAAVAVTPALAAPAPDVQAGSVRTSQAQRTVDRVRCAEAWRKAAANPTVESYQAVGTCEIDRRLATIDRLGNAIESARALTDDQQAALQRILDGSTAGLRALRAEIEADTTLAELRPDIKSIFEDYRIYVLVTRQVWLVTASDTVDAAGAALDREAADLQTLIDEAEANGKDVTDAKAHLGAMESAVDAALASVDGVAEDVLPLTPADWNAGAAGPILRAAHQSIVDARGDLRTAMSEARQVIAALAA